MKKVLLIGALNEVLRSVNDCLLDHFQVQLCSLQLDNIKGMIKIYRPNLIIICQIGVDEIEPTIYEWMNQRAAYIPTLIVTSKEVWDVLLPYCEDQHYETLFRPINSQSIMRKCSAMLSLEEEEGQEPKEDKPPVLKKKDRTYHILVVDDNAMVLRNIKGMLDPPYKITLAKSGETALALMERALPDLVLLDYEMPGLDGRETFEKILELPHGDKVPVLFLTGVSEKQKILSVLKNRPAGYVLKPPDREKLAEEIEHILAKYYS